MFRAATALGEPSTAAIELAERQPLIFWDWLSFGEAVADHREEEAVKERRKSRR